MPGLGNVAIPDSYRAVLRQPDMGMSSDMKPEIYSFSRQIANPIVSDSSDWSKFHSLLFVGLYLTRGINIFQVSPKKNRALREPQSQWICHNRRLAFN